MLDALNDSLTAWSLCVQKIQRSRALMRNSPERKSNTAMHSSQVRAATSASRRFALDSGLRWRRRMSK
jgi:hypothetical protein